MLWITHSRMHPFPSLLTLGIHTAKRCPVGAGPINLDALLLGSGAVIQLKEVDTMAVDVAVAVLDVVVAVAVDVAVVVLVVVDAADVVDVAVVLEALAVAVHTFHGVMPAGRASTTNSPTLPVNKWSATGGTGRSPWK